MSKPKRFEMRLSNKDEIVLRELSDIWQIGSNSSVVRNALQICRNNEHERQQEITDIKLKMERKGIKLMELADKKVKRNYLGR